MNKNHWANTGHKRKHYPRLMRTFYEPLIRELVIQRKMQGMGQLDVNEMIGCADNLIAKWEVGMKVPSLYYLLLWCEALGYELKLERVD